MKNKPYKQKKSPWIPPPAKTTKCPEKPKYKSNFEMIIEDNVCKIFDELPEVSFIKAEPESTTKIEISDVKRIEEEFENLNLVQKELLENSCHRINELKKEIKPDITECGFHEQANNDRKESNINEVEDQKSALVSKLRDFEANSFLLRKYLRDLEIKSKENVINETDMNIKKDDLLSCDWRKEDKQNCAASKIEENIKSECIKEDLNDKNLLIELKKENEHLKRQNKILEANRSTMLRERHRMEANMERMNLHLKNSGDDKPLNDYSSLFQELELVKRNFAAEKLTLKKMLKFEKRKAEKNYGIGENLRNQVSIKNEELKRLNLDCDRYKTEVEHLVQVRNVAESELSMLRQQVNKLEALTDKMKLDKDALVPDSPLYKTINKDEKNLHENPTICSEYKISQENHDKSELNVYDGDVTQNSLKYEFSQHFTDQSKLIMDLTKKIEQQAQQIKVMSDKTSLPADVKSKYEEKIEELNRMIKDIEKSNYEISLKLTKSEEALHYSERRYEEKSTDLVSNAKQLENSLLESKNEISKLRDNIVHLEKEKASLKSQNEIEINRLKNEIDHLKSEKNDREKEFNSKVTELNHCLEQAQGVNKSMQNYISFLKSSYANVFSDPVLSAMTTPTKIS